MSRLYRNAVSQIPGGSQVVSQKLFYSIHNPYQKIITQAGTNWKIIRIACM